MPDDRPGLLDTNVLIHALTRDSHGAECRAFLETVQNGERTIILTTVVAHEFTYAVSRYQKQMTREDVGDYLISLMALPSVRVEDDALFDTLRIWSQSDHIGFVDAYLVVRGKRDRLPVFTKNLKHFSGFDAEVPDSLGD